MGTKKAPPNLISLWDTYVGCEGDNAAVVAPKYLFMLRVTRLGLGEFSSVGRLFLLAVFRKLQM
jgi:hypothetical protein